MCVPSYHLDTGLIQYSVRCRWESWDRWEAALDSVGYWYTILVLWCHLMHHPMHSCSLPGTRTSLRVCKPRITHDRQHINGQPKPVYTTMYWNKPIISASTDDATHDLMRRMQCHRDIQCIQSSRPCTLELH